MILKRIACTALMIWLATSVAGGTEPALWLDAGNAKSLVIAEGHIERWASVAAKDLHLHQAKRDSRPQIGAQLNGRNTLHFAGDDFLEGAPVLTAGNDNFTIIALWRPHREAVQSIFEQAGPGRGGRAALLQVNAAYGFNGQSNDFHSAIKLAPRQWRLTALAVNGAAENNVLIIDNDAQPVVGSIDIQAQNVGDELVTVGKKIFGEEYFQGDLAELRVFDTALSPADLSAHLQAIKKTWGLKFESVVPTKSTSQEQPVAMDFKPTAEQLDFFETSVRPLLVTHCYECHSGKAEKLQGGLRLDSRERAIQGGETGAAVLPGQPAKSLLIDAIRWKSVEMPPQGKLKESEIAILTKWVEIGAPWPAETSPAITASPAGYDWKHWRSQHWAFQPVRKPLPPRVANEAWIKGDLDRFVLAKLELAKLKPAQPAQPRILVRRLYFTLIGLPPSSSQVDDFLAAWEQDQQQAVRNLVDQLLASPHYGERWGRHWLDVARYSDGYGGFLDNKTYPEAWRYRDWVVEAINKDLPLDQFLQLQIAGDLVGDRHAAVATGFFALGPTYSSDGGDPDSVAQAKAETLSDRLDTLARGMLGLTLACARCHDHKFDPLPQQDYYSLAGIFDNTDVQDAPLAASEVVVAFNQHQQAIGKLDQQIKDQQNKITKEKREASLEEKRQIEQWQAELTSLRKNAPPKYDVAHTLRDSGSSDMKLAIRGNLRKPGEVAPRRFLRVLAGDERAVFREGSGRRQLATAITDPANPLTTRVFVNRVWLQHFGAALVRTPSNFGALGEPPTHPELLDWLAATFSESGQSLKALHRTILLSSTWQMSSDYNAAAFAADGDNRLLWRMNARRLDAEAWRDALLCTTGELDKSLGGPPTEQVDSPRRTLYFKVSRNGDVFATDEFLRRFDFPIMRATVDQRPTSIVPQQFLFLMNSPFMLQRAKVLTKRLAEATDQENKRIDLAYRWLYQRPPTANETELGLAFLRETETTASGLSAWEQYAQVLLSANEFMYVR